MRSRMASKRLSFKPTLRATRVIEGRNNLYSLCNGFSIAINASTAYFRRIASSLPKIRANGAIIALACCDDAHCMRGNCLENDANTALRTWNGTGATPGLNNLTIDGNIKCKCSSTPFPNVSNALKTYGTAAYLPDRSASVNTATILGNNSGKYARNSSLNALDSSSHNDKVDFKSALFPQNA